ncbi:MAG: ATP-binding protein [Rubrivivax sp.]|nr:ATP-binding protein [Rubrivivax sp.]
MSERTASAADSDAAAAALTGNRGGLRIAIVGAESTGKTTLARELAAALAAAAGPGSAPQAPRVALVEEVLRGWCESAGRTPRRDEQRAILVEQHQRIDAAAATHDIVVCDTTGLMTHVYSELLFDDRSLAPLAVAHHRAMTATLLTALDLPWTADPGIRDGEHVREPVDDRLREVLLRHALPFAVVGGQGPARLAQACAALAAFPALARHAASPDDAGAAARAGSALFTRLALAPHGGDAAARGARRRQWLCDCCVPEAEQVLLAGRRRRREPSS